MMLSAASEHDTAHACIWCHASFPASFSGGAKLPK